MIGTGFGDDESGVSPVIGIVLMVAITVLLAATVAAFVFGFDDKAQNAQSPTVALGFDYDAGGGSHDTLVVKHQSGEAVAVENLYLQIDGATCSGGGPSPDGRYNVADEYSLSGDLKAGMTVLVDENNPVNACSSGRLDLSGARISVVWQSQSGTSTTLQSWEK
ncbi:type IV pilin [Halobacteriales archaeon Cl-PHB]